jgi:periplasmic divalent cation tolerance protein
VSGTTDGVRLILSTFADEVTATSVIRALLNEEFIACGSIVPGIRSIYRWKGNVEESAEVQVILKTTAERASQCMARLRVLHPYEVPEIIELEPSSVDASYASWIRESLSRGE